ncbi:protein VACUOLELESS GAMETOPHYTES-like [Mercurialis annua]|uniref:protein VACUOLELESS GAMETOPHYTES-like n=1 Tax=Mercurialis annua TaxID=3986 RepID=UPI00215EDBA7|nr:protein VACUOLELESS GAMETOPHYTES-like [Mercurialis annua]
MDYIQYFTETCHNLWGLDMSKYILKMSLSNYSYMHAKGSDHKLTYKLGVPIPTTNSKCHVCQMLITTGHSKCLASGCRFVAHVGCAPKWPEFAGHPQHSRCRLQLVLPRGNTYCLACQGVCTNRRYRCSLCHVDVHTLCILGPTGRPRPPPAVGLNLNLPIRHR